MSVKTKTATLESAAKTVFSFCLATATIIGGLLCLFSKIIESTDNADTAASSDGAFGNIPDGYGVNNFQYGDFIDGTNTLVDDEGNFE